MNNNVQNNINCVQSIIEWYSNNNEATDLVVNDVNLFGHIVKLMEGESPHANMGFVSTTWRKQFFNYLDQLGAEEKTKVASVDLSEIEAPLDQFTDVEKPWSQPKKIVHLKKQIMKALGSQ